MLPKIAEALRIDYWWPNIVLPKCHYVLLGIWHSSLSAAETDKIESIQHRPLRIITGAKSSKNMDMPQLNFLVYARDSKNRHCKSLQKWLIQWTAYIMCCHQSETASYWINFETTNSIPFSMPNCTFPEFIL